MFPTALVSHWKSENHYVSQQSWENEINKDKQTSVSMTIRKPPFTEAQTSLIKQK